MKKDILSKKFETYLLKNDPSLQKFFKWEKGENQFSNTYFLTLEIPSPNPKMDKLFVDCEPEEITVGVKEYHFHIDVESDRDFQECLNFIKKVKNEEIIFRILYKDGKWDGSYDLNLVEDWSNDFLERNPSIIEIRSWKGTYDKRYTLAEFLSLKNK